MKAILCGLCNDFRALHSTGSVSCKCGNVEGWWLDSHRGVAKVYAKHREYARILGFNNSFLYAAFNSDRMSDKQWRELAEHTCNDAEGYLFHKDRRNCPFLVIRIGESSDVTWAQEHYGTSTSPTPGYAGRDEVGGSDF